MKKIVVTFHFEGGTKEQYDQVWAELKAAGHENPKGLVFHVGAAKPRGWFVLDVWESFEAFQEFGNILMPIIHKGGLPPVQPEIMEVHNIYAMNKNLSMA